MATMGNVREPLSRILRAYALALIATVVLTLIFSRVPLNLTLIRGNLATGFAVAYLGALVLLIARPFSFYTHAATSVCGALYWLGRGGGFLEIVLRNPEDGSSPSHHWLVDIYRADLLGAVAERWSRALIIVLWHMMAWLVISLIKRYEFAHDL